MSRPARSRQVLLPNECQQHNMDKKDLTASNVDQRSATRGTTKRKHTEVNYLQHWTSILSLQRLQELLNGGR